MINKFIRCVFVISMVSQAAFSELPDNYQSLSAFEKESLLWNEILSSPWKSLPPLSGKGWGSILANLKSLTSLKTTFDHQSDTIPEERIKIIHTYGSVARMLFLPADQTPFTGLLNEVNVVHGRFH